MISGIASWRVSLQHWLIIKLWPVFLGKTWLWQHRYYVLNMSVNGVPMTFGLVSPKMQRLCCHIKPYSNNPPPFYTKMVATTSLLCTKHEHQRNVNIFWPCILENARVVWPHWPIIKLLAAFLSENASHNIITMPITMSLDRASTIYGHASWKIKRLCDYIDP
jgi:hypothetical protein